MRYIDVAVLILQQENKTLHVSTIVERAQESGYWQAEDAAVLKAKFASALWQNARTSDPQVRSGISNGRTRGFYRLVGPARIRPAPEQLTAESSFVGKAGEYAVASELLFRGFNVSMMVVDKGVDVVAEKDRHYFHLQVKTTIATRGESCRFKLDRAAFDRNDRTSSFYVLVIRDRVSPSQLAIVLPATQLRTWMARGVLNGESAAISLRVERNGSSGMLLNGSASLDEFVNAYELIH